ncbi:MAG TPA: hypothetical protein VGM94_05140 [Galbitalea sp.]
MINITELQIADEVTADLGTSHIEGRITSKMRSSLFDLPTVRIHIPGEAIERQFDSTWTFNLVHRPGAAA